MYDTSWISKHKLLWTLTGTHMKLTKLQIHNREKFVERSTMRGHVQRFADQRADLGTALMRASAAERALKEREKWTVCIGIEKGLSDPSYVLTVHVHPYEFKHSLLAGARPQYGMPDFQNTSYRAAMIGRETGDKVARVLQDFAEGRLTPETPNYR